MKTNKKELENKMLNKDQVETVKQMIIGSMRNVYTNAGSLPGDGFEDAANSVADQIIKNTQMALVQSNVYADTVKNIYDDNKVVKAKTKKTIKKVVKKVTKKGKK